MTSKPALWIYLKEFYPVKRKINTSVRSRGWGGVGGWAKTKKISGSGMQKYQILYKEPNNRNQCRPITD